MEFRWRAAWTSDIISKRHKRVEGEKLLVRKRQGRELVVHTYGTGAPYLCATHQIDCFYAQCTTEQDFGAADMRYSASGRNTSESASVTADGSVSTSTKNLEIEREGGVSSPVGTWLKVPDRWCCRCARSMCWRAAIGGCDIVPEYEKVNRRFESLASFICLARLPLPVTDLQCTKSPS